MPTHPSTHVTHIPLKGLIEPSVRFFVRVAAEAFNLERVMIILLSSMKIAQRFAGGAVLVQLEPSSTMGGKLPLF
jgi:hypothetical protein